MEWPAWGASCLALLLAYVAYYRLRVLKVPRVVCGGTELVEALSEVLELRRPLRVSAWAVGAHLQTVLGGALRARALPPLPRRRQLLPLADGGELALDWLVGGEGDEGEAKGQPVLVAVPGLTGDSSAEYVRALAAGAALLGAECVAFNNRGRGGVALKSPRLYSALSDDDVEAALEAVAARRPGAPLLLVGVSMGGLLAGQYLARTGARALPAAALLVSAPLDVPAGSLSLETRGLNAAMSAWLARELRTTLAHHAPPWAELRAGAERAAAADSVRAFDAAFTSAHAGCRDLEEYYARASLADKLRRVARPTLCLNAADDPFQPLAALAQPLREAALCRRVAVAVTARGGHVGFVDSRWPWWAPEDDFLARITHQYFAAVLSRPDLLLPSSNS